MDESKKEEGKAYNSAAISVGSAIESMIKSDGWSIFMALFERKQKEIQLRSDYESLEEFKADRKAIDIVHELVDITKTFKEDADSILDSMKKDGEQVKSRGIMMLDTLEGGNREG